MRYTSDDKRGAGPFLIVLLVGLLSTPGAVRAQAVVHGSQDASSGEVSVDHRILRSVYHAESPVLRATMRAADASAFPVYYGAPVAAWSGAWLIREDSDFTDAYRLTVAQAVTFGSVLALKRTFRHPRPYKTVPGIRARKDKYRPGGRERHSFAMPSGHASLAVAIVTSWSLSHPKWYVIGPGAVWATSVAMSRVWLGVHYPSDVVAGTLLGAAVGVGVHLLGSVITPAFLREDGESVPPPMMSVQIRF